ncbi:hypothetical protein GOODEAATRI_009937 [Goodea atripinnis]|uniref:Uncharacterized protein n=1 Tax=Goodea atripinnis TaxID=208336 RepID=A0ABV0NVU3_9TELE
MISIILQRRAAIVDSFLSFPNERTGYLPGETTSCQLGDLNRRLFYSVYIHFFPNTNAHVVLTVFILSRKDNKRDSAYAVKERYIKVSIQGMHASEAIWGTTFSLVTRVDSN